MQERNAIIRMTAERKRRVNKQQSHIFLEIQKTLVFACVSAWQISDGRTDELFMIVRSNGCGSWGWGGGLTKCIYTHTRCIGVCVYVYIMCVYECVYECVYIYIYMCACAPMCTSACVDYVHGRASTCAWACACACCTCACARARA